MARPREIDRDALLIALRTYVKDTAIPIVAEFASLQGLHRQQLYDMPELSDALKACVTKKEGALERAALDGDVNCTMAIFSLKQLGWKDTHENTLKSDGPVSFQLVRSDMPVVPPANPLDALRYVPPKSEAG